MTAREFEKFWESNYEDCPMIGNVLRKSFNERWFRIHSLPESRRYPKNKKHWNILLERHNQIITDIVGNDSKVILVTGSYYIEENAVFDDDDENFFKPYNLIEIGNVDLHKLDPVNYDSGQIFKPSFTEIIWNANEYDSILTAVAEDEIRFFFISQDKNTIIAPYDGGIDFIMKDTKTKDFYKEKYRAWLPQNDQGL